ncbi:MAG TPA: peptidylprolyl isomerase [Verrucomicrobiae bacterium]|nr:peptidylprolyl isomerase [Verrucomicrobiae bacterium]
MKQLLGLLTISGAVLGALFFLTNLAGSGAGGPPAQAVSLKAADQIEEGSIVSIEYTLTDESGKVIDTNVGKEPLTYIQGAGQIVAGLEKELHGLKLGEQAKVRVKPEDGYGALDPEARQEIDKDKIPPEAQQVGAMLMSKGADGRPVPIRVHEIRDKTVIVDFNHPLAGKTLNFDVKITDIKTAAAPG